MIREQNTQNEMEYITIDDMVPEDHILRKIDKVIDFRFIREKTKALYSQNRGRPATDPVVLFKALLLGYLFGIKSERRLVEEIKVNVAYRWFLGLKLKEKVMDHSTFSQNRRRRFKGSQIYQEIFVDIVNQAVKHRMVGGEEIFTDSTHIKANANKRKYKKRTVKKEAQKYLDELDNSVNQEREKRGKEPLKAGKSKVETKEISESTTDPESGMMKRDGKPVNFHYLDHRSVDGLHNIIVDTFASRANINDNIPYVDRLNFLIKTYGWKIKRVALDSSYYTHHICKVLGDKQIYGVIAKKTPKTIETKLNKKDFRYDRGNDVYICPENKTLKYAWTDRSGNNVYRSDYKDCISCSLYDQCTKKADHTRIVHRHVWEDYKDEVTSRIGSPEYKRLMSKRQRTVELSFADAKVHHNHREAQRRGLANMQEQAYLCATAQNIKTIALFISKSWNKLNSDAKLSLFTALKNEITRFLSFFPTN